MPNSPQTLLKAPPPARLLAFPAAGQIVHALGPARKWLARCLLAVILAAGLPHDERPGRVAEAQAETVTPGSEAARLSAAAEQLRRKGKYAEAEDLYRRALAIRESTLGRDHPQVATTLIQLAHIYRVQRRYAEAEPLLKRALAIREKALGPGHPEVTAAVNDLIGLYRVQGRRAEAAALARRTATGRDKPEAAQDPGADVKAKRAADELRIREQRAAAEAAAKRAAEEKRLAEQKASEEAVAKKAAEELRIPEQKAAAEAAAKKAAEEKRFAEQKAAAEKRLAERQGGARQKAAKAPRDDRPTALEQEAPDTTSPPVPAAPPPPAERPKSAPPPAATNGDQPSPQPTKPDGTAARKRERPPSPTALSPPPPPPAQPLRAPPKASEAPGTGGTAAPEPPESEEAGGSPRRAAKNGGSPRGPAPVPVVDQRWDVVPVFYGTDRATEPGTERVVYGVDRGRRLELGRALVTVPKVHEVPQIERPWILRLPFTQVVLFEEREDPAKHFTLKEVKVLTREEFLKLVRERLAASKAFKNHAVVFVHGFNTSFPYALYRTAQVAYDLKFDGAPFVYSWPSKGGGLQDYPYDRESAQQAEPHLLKFLELVVSETGAEKVSIIAHSMGNQALLPALRTLKGRMPRGVTISQVILAAPDVDRDAFEFLVGEIRGISSGMTLYAAANDRALTIARRIYGAPRAGDVPEDGPVVMTDVDTIDVTAMSTDWFALNHSGYAEKTALLSDIQRLIQTGERPPDRRVPILQRQLTAKGAAYWRYPTVR